MVRVLLGGQKTTVTLFSFRQTCFFYSHAIGSSNIWRNLQKDESFLLHFNLYYFKIVCEKSDFDFFGKSEMGNIECFDDLEVKSRLFVRSFLLNQVIFAWEM